MLSRRKAEDRGHANFGWLDSRHTFSFGQYHDPKHMGFGPLRVINDDRVAPGRGFGTHGHKDMEILTYVLDGALAHKDSLGTGSVIKPGDVQVMSAGTGIEHSEFNASQTDPVHFLQIWMLPTSNGLKPRYDQKSFGEAEKSGQLKLVGSHDGRDGSVTIHSPVDLYAARLGDADKLSHTFAVGNKGWLQVATGAVVVNGQALAAGDGLAIDGGETVTMAGSSKGAEVLLFEMT
jgi:quercetin 2,3-dioxygenase